MFPSFIMAQLTRFFVYKLDANQGPVTLTVSIGNAQSATTSLYLDSQTLTTNAQDSFSFPIENAGGLSGKELDISSTIVDTNPDSNDIMYRIKITGGDAVLNPPGDRLRVSANGIAYFLFKIIFV
jgi:hypothetical protein